MFQTNLAAQLTLLRVTAPMVVLSGTGINDDLNGVERLHAQGAVSSGPPSLPVQP